MYTIKKVEPDPNAPIGFNIPEQPDMFEFFTTKTLSDVNNQPFDVLESVGVFSLESLQTQKGFHESAVLDITEKIDLINQLNG